MGSRVRLFPYALCQTCLAKGVGVGKQRQQIGGNVWMVIRVCVCVCICPWNNTLRLSSDHTDSLPSPAVPQIHFTAAFLHSEAWRRSQQHARPTSKTREGGQGAQHYSERQIGHPNKTWHPEHGTWTQNWMTGCAHVLYNVIFQLRHSCSQVFTMKWPGFLESNPLRFIYVLSLWWPANIACCDAVQSVTGFTFHCSFWYLRRIVL